MFSKEKLQELSNDELNDILDIIQEIKDDRNIAEYKKIREKISGGHKYLNDLGISSNETCVFNTLEKENSDDINRNVLFEEQRKTYGFDERETWCLSYTLITWIYSHLKWYIENAPIDFTFYKFDIPTLRAIPKEKLEWIDPSKKTIAKVYYEEIIQNMTQEQAMQTALQYMEYYFRHKDGFLTEEENKAYEKAKCALHIIAILFPALWW